MLTALLATMLAALPAVSAASRVPNQNTPVNKLSARGLVHTEMLRISRDFGKKTHQIALDGWVARGSSEIAEVRLWWVKINRNGERGPFGPKTRRHFDLDYKRLSQSRWDVHLSSGRKTFTFNVELDSSGKPGAFATVVADDGRRVRHCRTTSGQIVARRFLGAPVGISKVRVTCIDDNGNKHRGRLSHKRRRG